MNTMKKNLVVWCLCLLIITQTVVNKALAQQAPTMDHIALYVFDLEKSTAFYKDVMQFKLVSEPFKDGKHSWFKVGEHSRLHIIKGAADVKEHDINSHFAYHVKVLKDFTDHLDKMNIKYGNWTQDSKQPTVRPDGVKQVYFQDPDNYWIEVNDDKL
jgi:lactoylglutathione lyase